MARTKARGRQHRRGRALLGTAALLVAAPLAAAGCGGAAPAGAPHGSAGPLHPPQAAAPEAAAPDATAPDASAPGVAPAPPAAVVGDVRLTVTGFHVLPLPAGDTGAQRTATELGVPVADVSQLHLLLALHNTAGDARSVAGDVLHLAVGGRTVEAAPADVFPPGPLAPGQQVDTAAGYAVAVRGAADGPVALRWTHGADTAVLPVGGVRRAD